MSELWIRIKQVLAKAWEIFQMLLGLAFILFLLVSCFSSNDKKDGYQRNHHEDYRDYEDEKWSLEGDYIGS